MRTGVPRPASSCTLHARARTKGRAERDGRAPQRRPRFKFGTKRFRRGFSVGMRVMLDSKVTGVQRTAVKCSGKKRPAKTLPVC